MNFHKTIGFLATLLLTLGLGVPDSSAQNAISVALVPPPEGVIEETETAVTVLVTVSPVPAAGITVTVSVELTATMLDGTEIGFKPIIVEATDANQGVRTVDMNITPPGDADADNETAQVTATATDYASGSDAMVIVDDDPTIEVTFSTQAGEFREGTTVDGVVVQVQLVQNSPTGREDIPVIDITDPVTVTVSFAPNEFASAFRTSDPTVSIPIPLEMEILAFANSSVLDDVSLVVKDNDAKENTKVTATASSTGYVDGTTELTIEDDEETLTLEVEPPKFTEGDPDAILVVTATLESAPVTATSVTVTAIYNGISISSASAVISIPIAANSGSEVLTGVTILPDDDVYSGDRTIVLTAAFGEGPDRITSNSVTVTVVDDDQDQTLTLTLNPDELREGGVGEVAVTVALAYPVANDVVVDVTATIDGIPITEREVIVIPDGTDKGDFTLTIELPDDNVDSGDRMIVVTAAATIDGTLLSDNQNVTVKDNDAPLTPPVGVGSVTISTSVSNLRENAPGRDVVVTATLSDAPGTGTTVTVTVTAEVPDQETTASVSGPIIIVGPATTGTTTVNIDPSNDEEFTTRSVELTGSATGFGSATATIGIIDDEPSLGTLTIASNPPSLNKVNTGQEVKVKVTAAMADKSLSTATVTVTLTTDKGMFGTATVTVLTIPLGDNPDKDPATVAPDGDETATLTVSNSVANAGGEIKVTASADGFEMDTFTIPIRDRVAGDVVGFRVVMTKPGAGAWVGVGDKKVTVEVRRVEGIAYPWTDFTSVRVSLRDTAEVNEAVLGLAVPLEASGFNQNEDGNITFKEVSSGGDDDKITYTADDALKFELKVLANIGSAPGRYRFVYAQAEFVYGTTTETLTNSQTDTPIYSDPDVLSSFVPNEADRYVGDGKLIKIDNRKPNVDGVSDIDVTIDDDGAATVGDKVRVAVKVGTSGTLFRDSQVQIQLKTVNKTVGGVLRKAVTAKTATFSGPKVIAAAADSLRVTWDVTEGLFKLNLDDFVEGIGPKGTQYQPDNAVAQVFVFVKDQANNSAKKSSDEFLVDSKSPSVSILYPSEDPDSAFAHDYSMRFTGAMISTVEGQTVDEHLNPLRIAVNEDLSKLEVFAVGSLDTLEIEHRDTFASGAIEDSIVVDTQGLSSPKKDEDDDYEDTEFVPSSANRAGTEIELAVLATDILGNVTKATISGVTHDAAPPTITEWFPKNRLIEDDQINDATRHPIFTLKEDVDSIGVTFTSSGADNITEEVDGLTEKGETQVVVTDALEQDELYTMTIFVRDLAGNVFITDADSSANMEFNANFDNPKANDFTVTNKTAVTETNETAVDSVIAGQALLLEIQAVDRDAASNTSRDALTYKNIDEDGNMAAEVRISAWDASGDAAESVWFDGKDVMDDADNPNGQATLGAGGWTLGKRTVVAKSNKALDNVKILVEHRIAGAGNTTVPVFDEAIENLYVGAADFSEFEVTASDNGVTGDNIKIWGTYTLLVVPTDRYGNPSVRAFKEDPANAQDSLALLDTRVKDKAFEYKDGFVAEIVGLPDIPLGQGFFTINIGKSGFKRSLTAPDDGDQYIRVKVSNEELQVGDTRSRNKKGEAYLTVSAPLTPVLTLWVPGSDVDEAGNDVVVPADGITVTVAADGFNAGDMVTFTRDGTAMDPVTANDDGVAKLDIPMSAAGTVTVSASNGVYSAELPVVFVDAPTEPVEPTRKSYVDAAGEPVYLVYTEDAPSDMTVGLDDFNAFANAFGSSKGDENYNLQADIDGDGDVDLDDYRVFIASYGRTATGPATKPIVMLPGINESAEFSLSLGSERVVAGELVAVDVSLANVAALAGYGFTLNYENDKFEFISVAPADEDLLKSTGGETPLFHHIVADGQVEVANSIVNGSAVSGGGDIVRFVFRVLREFEDNARFEIADGLVFDPSQLQNPAVVAGVLELQSTPREFALHQNFPNPFNPDTTIKYDLAESADITLQIYNVLGQVVRTLVASEAQNAGRYQIRWNGMDDRGVSVSSGIYFYQISADGKFHNVRKLMLLK